MSSAERTRSSWRQTLRLPASALTRGPARLIMIFMEVNSTKAKAGMGSSWHCAKKGGDFILPMSPPLLSLSTNSGRVGTELCVLTGRRDPGKSFQTQFLSTQSLPLPRGSGALSTTSVHIIGFRHLVCSVLLLDLFFSQKFVYIHDFLTARQRGTWVRQRGEYLYILYVIVYSSFVQQSQGEHWPVLGHGSLRPFDSFCRPLNQRTPAKAQTRRMIMRFRNRTSTNFGRGLGTLETPTYSFQ
jgi:hypothetical protein